MHSRKVWLEREMRLLMSKKVQFRFPFSSEKLSQLENRLLLRVSVKTENAHCCVSGVCSWHWAAFPFCLSTSSTPLARAACSSWRDTKAVVTKLRHRDTSTTWQGQLLWEIIFGFEGLRFEHVSFGATVKNACKLLRMLPVSYTHLTLPTNREV